MTAAPVLPDNFCPRCGAALTTRPAGGRARAVCPDCGHRLFGRFSLAVGGLLFHEGRALFVQRGRPPGRGRWTLPGGYVEEDETPDAAVVREVLEETGLRVSVTQLLAVRSTMRDVDQNIYFVFGLALDGPPHIQADGDETARAGFFAPETFDSLAGLTPLTRWIAERGQAAGLRRVPGEAALTPLTGYRWTLFGVVD